MLASIRKVILACLHGLILYSTEYLEVITWVLILTSGHFSGLTFFIWSWVLRSYDHWSEVKSLSCVQLLVTPWTAAYHASPSMGFSRVAIAFSSFPAAMIISSQIIESHDSLGKHQTILTYFSPLYELGIVWLAKQLTITETSLLPWHTFLLHLPNILNYIAYQSVDSRSLSANWKMTAIVLLAAQHLCWHLSVCQKRGSGLGNHQNFLGPDIVLCPEIPLFCYMPVFFFSFSS